MGRYSSATLARGAVVIAVIAMGALGIGLAQTGTPRIQLFEGTAIPAGSTGIPDDTGTVNFGTTVAGTPRPITFTVRNAGTANLTLSGPINLPTGFTLTAGFGTTTLAPNATTTFVVALNPAAPGVYTGMLSFGTNDPVRNPFNVTITGSATAPPGLAIIDNGDAGYSTAGRWFSQPDAAGAFGKDFDRLPPGAGANTASWTFTGLAPGSYRVAATWRPDAGAAGNARYSVLDGTRLVGEAFVNQAVLPASFIDAGQPWHDLGEPYTISGTTLTVRLSDQANGTVTADAVRIERVGFMGKVVDNGESAFSTTGAGWATRPGGMQDQVHVARSTSGANTATWTFTGLAPGLYRVSATWAAQTGNATNAPYTVLNGNMPLTTIRVNQSQPPGTFTDAGVRWQDLGGPYPIAGGTLRVRLTDQANGQVVADAVRIERVSAAQLVSLPDAVRFLQQATWGPTDGLIAYVRSIGFNAWLDEQFALPASGYPTLPLFPNDSATGCPANPNDPNAQPICIRDNYTMYPLQCRFFTNALYGRDQLRQRVAFALHQIVVVSGLDVTQPSWMTPYLQICDRHAFGNYRQFLQEITLNAGMGNYLDMALSTRTRPNENYARELLQLFSIGLFELNPDGTFKIDPNTGQAIPTYDQTVVDNFTRVLTGWSFAPRNTTRDPPGSTNYLDPMVVNPNNHDFATPRPVLFNNYQLPTGRSGIAGATADLNDTLDNVYNHPNVGPFISKQLIQHLVTSNPSPAYVARVAAVFDAHRTSPHQLREVVRAILLDPEARGDFKTDPTYGHLKHPALFLLNVLRPFRPLSANRTALSDGHLNPQITSLGMDIYRPPSVFSYYPPDKEIAPGVLGPEFGILNTSTTLARANRADSIAIPNSSNTSPIRVLVGVSRDAPAGTSIDLTELVDLAAADPSGNLLLDKLNILLMAGSMSSEMRASILTAISPSLSGNTPLRRARTALYLVISSAQFQVQR